MTTSPRSKSVRRCSISCLVSSTLSDKSSPARHRQVLCSRRSTGLRHVLSSEREPQWHGLVQATTLSIGGATGDSSNNLESVSLCTASPCNPTPKRVGTISHSCFTVTRSALHYRVGPSFARRCLGDDTTAFSSTRRSVEEWLSRNHVRWIPECNAHACVPVPSLGMRHSFDEA